MQVNRNSAKLILSWIVSETKQYNNIPKLIFSKRNAYRFGEYDFKRKTITIFESNHQNNFEEFLDTILHEFGHHLQNTKSVRYPRLNKCLKWTDVRLRERDFETHAKQFANKYKKKFLKIIC